MSVEDAVARMRDGRARVVVVDRQIGPLVADLVEAAPESETAQRIAAVVDATFGSPTAVDTSQGIGWPRSR